MAVIDLSLFPSFVKSGCFVAWKWEKKGIVFYPMRQARVLHETSQECREKVCISQCWDLFFSLSPLEIQIPSKAVANGYSPCVAQFLVSSPNQVLWRWWRLRSPRPAAAHRDSRRTGRTPSSSTLPAPDSSWPSRCRSVWKGETLEQNRKKGSILRP